MEDEKEIQEEEIGEVEEFEPIEPEVEIPPSVKIDEEEEN